jgi:nitrogen regulatory protein P-II 1
MILIEAFVKPFKLDDIREALEELGAGGMTVTEVMQAAAEPAHGRSFGAPGAASDLVPKVKIEVAVPDRLVERVIEAVCLHGSAGKREDGRIVVRPLHGAIRIRTGDEGDEALSF